MSNNLQINNITTEITFLEEQLLSLNKLYNYTKLNLTDNIQLNSIDNLLYYTNYTLNIKKTQLIDNYNFIKNNNSKKRPREYELQTF